MIGDLKQLQPKRKTAVMGYRVWKVRGKELHAQYRSFVWKRGTTVADVPPLLYNYNGLWMHKSYSAAHRRCRNNEVMGLVRGTGTTVYHTRGYRTAKAKILALIEPTSTPYYGKDAVKLARRIATRYGVRLVTPAVARQMAARRPK
jgi:hypothetical protein